MDQHPAASSQTSHSTNQAILRVALPFVSGETGTDRLEGELAFDPTDPYAVTMRLEARGGSVTWIFARELLADGLYEPAGAGDVQVWPCLSSTGDAVIVIELSSPDGCAVLQTESRAVQRFVASTHGLVPAGQESAQMGMDDLVSRLLVS